MPEAPEIQVFRHMDPAKKLALIGSMHAQAREWKRAALRSMHPDWSSQQVEKKLREVFLYGSI